MAKVYEILRRTPDRPAISAESMVREKAAKLYGVELSSRQVKMVLDSPWDWESTIRLAIDMGE